MRFIRGCCTRKRFFFLLSTALIPGSVWVFATITQSPITIANSNKLDGMTRSDAEKLLGAPTSPVRIVYPKPYKNLWAGLGGQDYPDFWWFGLDIPGLAWLNFNGEPVVPAQRIGDLMPGRFGTISLRYDRPLWVEVCTWDGPEAQISASFDDKGKMYGYRVQGRMSWRTKVREWLPWLP